MFQRHTQKPVILFELKVSANIGTGQPLLLLVLLAPVVVGVSGETKVAQFDDTILVDEDVLWLNITMDALWVSQRQKASERDMDR